MPGLSILPRLAVEGVRTCATPNRTAPTAQSLTTPPRDSETEAVFTRGMHGLLHLIATRASRRF